MSELVPPSLKPLDVDGVSATVAGTIAWAIALVLLALRWNTLVLDEHQWWLWTAVAGVVIGLISIAYCVRRRDSIAARADAAEAAATEPADLAQPGLDRADET